MTLRPRYLLMIAAAPAVLASMSACSGASPTAGSTTPGTSPVGTITAQSTASTSATSGSSTGDECGGAVARVTPAVASFPQVSKITMIAACGEVSIETTMPPGVLGSASTDTGIKICEAAAAVAYQATVKSVTVSATDGSELSIGLKGQDCIP